MLAILAWILGVLVALLLVPVHLHLEVNSRAPRWRLRVTWLFGLIRLRRASCGAGRPRRGAAKRSADGGRDRARGRAPARTPGAPGPGRAPALTPGPDRGRTLARGLAFARTPGAPGRALQCLRALLASLHLSLGRLRLVLGLDDPADTGLAWAVLGALSGSFSASLPGPPALSIGPGGLVHIEPSFTEAVLAIEGRARATVIPLQILAILARFALAPATLRALLALRRTRPGRWRTAS